MTISVRLALAAAALAAIAASAPAQSSQEAPLAIQAQDPALKWGPCPEIFPAGCEIAVLHGDPAQPNADVFLRVPGGAFLPPHSHTSAERMVLIGGELNVRYKGTPMTTLTPGEYAYGPAGLPHEASCAGSEPCILFIAFEGPVDAHAFGGTLD